MSFRYLPMTEHDKREMLQVIGVDSVDKLFSDIPDKVLFKGKLNIKEPKAETSLMNELTDLANKNINTRDYTSFLGAGVYRSLYTVNRRSYYFKIRVLYSLYTLSTGNFTRRITSDF